MPGWGPRIEILVRISHKRPFFHAFCWWISEHLEFFILERELAISLGCSRSKYLKYLEWDPVIFQINDSRCYLFGPIPKIQAFVCTEIAFWSCVNISQLFVVENIRGTKNKNRRREAPDDGRGFCFFSRRKTKGEIFLTKNRYRIFNQPGTETIRASGRQPTE